jgi:hypothetical protein
MNKFARDKLLFVTTPALATRSVERAKTRFACRAERLVAALKESSVEVTATSSTPAAE